MESVKDSFYSRFLKLPLDFVLSLIAVIVLSPVLLAVAIAVRIKLGSPVLFRQERAGLNEKIFEIYKFRSMTDERDAEGNLLDDSVRLTGFGRFLRASSLDELPGLLNVLKGDMAVIGPRPLVKEYLPFYTEEERLRHSVRPGLSGLAQINGRNSVTWEQKFYFDIQYVRQISLKLDLLIIYKTVLLVLKRSDVGERGTDGIEDFNEHRKKVSGSY
ncbi:sugar transferase [Planococcus sp. CAU13]|uniref:sugar transferase n=1 Tax=Planococcus sp. CAU13 TaxID=1541197 RepID=UPI00052FF8DE|nr:sugar transferase [Planococcus sp. CAU13]